MNRLFYIVLSFIPVIAGSQVLPPFWVDQDTNLCAPGPVPLTANVNLPGANYGTTSYAVSSIPYAPDPYNGGPPIGPWQINGDDEVFGPFNIGFTFCFMGQARTQFYIGTNGWVGFSGGPTNYTSIPIPSTSPTIPKDCIMGPFQDWYPGFNNASVNFAIYGTIPFRRLVISWDNTAMFQCTNLQGRFQIVLFETSNVIDNNIQNKPNCPSWAGGTAIQGLHDPTGTVAFTVPGRNSTQWTTTNNSYRFTPNGVFTPYTINWFDLPGNNPVGTGLNVTVNPLVNTQYYAVITYACSNGTDSDTVDVNISTPMTTATSFSDDTCAISSGTASVIVNGGVGPYTYVWSNGDSGLLADSLAGGTYTVVITDANNCTVSAVATVTALLPPVANFLWTPNVITLIDPEAFFTDLSSAVVTWYWDFGDGDTSGSQNPSHVYLLDGSYVVTLIITDQFGCMDTITDVILVEGYYTFYIPNAFTPNNSGIFDNEEFYAEFTGIESNSFSMYIYDRWGELIFKTNDVNARWNGKRNNTGQLVPEGVYTYVFAFKDFKLYPHEIRGHVSVIR